MKLSKNKYVILQQLSNYFNLCGGTFVLVNNIAITRKKTPKKTHRQNSSKIQSQNRRNSDK